MTSTATRNSCAGTNARPGWPTTRILFLLAGSVTLLSALLGATVSTWFLLLTGFVGLNQLVYVVAGACPASLIIDRLRPTFPARR